MPKELEEKGTSGSNLAGETGAGGETATGGEAAISGGTAGATTSSGGATSTSGGASSSSGGAPNAGGATSPTANGGTPLPSGSDGGANSGGVSSNAGGAESGGAPPASTDAGISTGGTSGGGGIRPMTCAPLGAPNTCGDGKVDPGEQCDGPDVRGLTCTTLDPFFTDGTLRCNTNCTLMTGECNHGTCGNGVVDPGEDCDYLNYTDVPCSTIFPQETDNARAACTGSICKYDLTTCSAAPTPVCGNGRRESGEQCDGEDWLWRSCVEPGALTYTGGQLHCNQATCQLDYTQCTRCDDSRCGDGVIDSDEECDGTNLGTHSCLDMVRFFGTVSCLSNCRVDYSKCPGCTLFKGRLICN